MFCDQDDVWLHEKISQTLSRAIEADKLDPTLPLMVHCDSIVTNKALCPIAEQFVGRRAKHSGLRSVLLANPAQGATIMINAKLRDLMLLRTPGALRLSGQLVC